MVYQLQIKFSLPCLCIVVTKVFSAVEMTFSVLKRIKDYLRNKTEQDRLHTLAVLRIESEIALFLDYDLIINKFVECKVRKKCSARVGLLLLIAVDCMSIK